MDKKYMLMRKEGKKHWQIIYMTDDDGSHKLGGTTTNLARAVKEREQLQETFPAEKYAIVELGDF